MGTAWQSEGLRHRTEFQGRGTRTGSQGKETESPALEDTCPALKVTQGSSPVPGSAVGCYCPTTDSQGREAPSPLSWPSHSRGSWKIAGLSGEAEGEHDPDLTPFSHRRPQPDTSSSRVVSGEAAAKVSPLTEKTPGLSEVFRFPHLNAAEEPPPAPKTCEAKGADGQVLKLQHLRITWNLGENKERRAHPGLSDSAGLGLGPGICTSHRFSGDTAAPGRGPLKRMSEVCRTSNLRRGRCRLNCQPL